MRRLAAVLLLGGQVLGAHAEPVTVEDLRVWQTPERTRLVFDLSAPVEYKVGVLTGPHRVYLDFPDARLAQEMSHPEDGPLLSNIRTGHPRPGVLRVVFNLKSAVQPDVFRLEPNQDYGHRLVVDLRAHSPAGPDKEEQKPDEIQTVMKAPAEPEEFIVAIDAGHGGRDPGAIGKYGTREEDVTLAIAQELKALVDRDPAMKSLMVRKGDYKVPLRERTEIAREARASLFISIHADAVPQRYVRGSSVYALSTRGASSELARFLSKRENMESADERERIGGVELAKLEDPIVKRVIWELSMTKTTSDSRELAQDILRELGQVGRVHRNRVEYAGFVVLKSPDIPSVLVESAFLSNPQEEQLLRTSSHRRKIAAAIYDGVRRYYERHHPGSRPAYYVVKRGDTLSEIAERYRISVSDLKRVNDMTSNVVRVGQKLRIPSG